MRHKIKLTVVNSISEGDEFCELIKLQGHKKIYFAHRKIYFTKRLVCHNHNF